MQNPSLRIAVTDGDPLDPADDEKSDEAIGFGVDEECRSNCFEDGRMCNFALQAAVFHMKWLLQEAEASMKRYPEEWARTTLA